MPISLSIFLFFINLLVDIFLVVYCNAYFKKYKRNIEFFLDFKITQKYAVFPPYLTFYFLLTEGETPCTLIWEIGE